MIKITEIMREATAHHIATKPMAAMFPDVVDIIKRGACPLCGAYHSELNDPLSVREYNISGMCQICQNETFG